jgi:rhodanese-related sulfurtransferase
VRQLSADDVIRRLAAPSALFILDVREPQEYAGELGHIPGSTLVPLRELADRVVELQAHKGKQVVVVCRSGVRSTTAAAILEGLGFENVFNLQGGMVDWNDRRLPVER